MMAGLSGIAHAADERAMALVAEGSTAPELAEEISWGNSEDWTMDSIANESKTAFVQWAPSR